LNKYYDLSFYYHYDKQTDFSHYGYSTAILVIKNSDILYFIDLMNVFVDSYKTRRLLHVTPHFYERENILGAECGAGNSNFLEKGSCFAFI